MRNNKRITERNLSRIEDKNYYGIGKNIKNFEKLIIESYFDEKKLKEFLKNNDMNSFTHKENFTDGFRQYLKDISPKFEDLKDKILSFFDDTMKKASKRIFDKNGTPIKFDEVRDENITNLITENQRKFLANLQESQTKKVFDIVKEGEIKGKSTDEIANEITKGVKEVTKNRAKTIARTELVKAHNLSQVKQMENAKVKTYNYITANDGKESKICLHNQGSFSSPNSYDLQLAGTPKSPLPVTNSHPNCFDEETEVLTNQGFKYFKNVQEEKDLIVTYNEKTKFLELQKGKNISYIFKGNLFHLKNKSLDIMSTPEHRFITVNKNSNCVKTMWELYNLKGSKNLPIKSNGLNNKLEKEFIEIGKYKFKISDYAKFLGIFLAEGNTSQNSINNTVDLACHTKKEKDYIKSFLNSMNLNYNEEEYRIRLYNKTLADYFKPLSVGSNNKVIPDYVFTWSKDLILDFINAYHEGDGNKAYWGARRIWTTSKIMASQLQSLFIIVGLDASITINRRNKAIIKGKECKAKDLFCVQERLSNTRSFKPSQIVKNTYEGKVYCVEVPNDTIIIRRNYKVAIVKNCRCSIVVDEFYEVD